jgi:Zn-dependent protease with chaperone function
MRRFMPIPQLGSLAALSLLASGVFTGLVALVALNAPAILRALNTPRGLVGACLLLFSLGPAQPALILSWFLLVGVGLWLFLRFAYEAGRRWARTRRATAALCRAPIRPLPPALDSLCGALRLRGRLDLVDLSQPVALCHGLAAPRIAISAGLVERLRPSELEAVLLHERAHLVRRDPLRLLLAQSLAAAFRPLALTSALALRLVAEQEVAADREAVKVQGGPGDLAGALVCLSQEAGPQPQLRGLAVSGISSTAVRVQALLDASTSSALLALPRATIHRAMVVLGGSLLAGVAFTAAVHAGHLVHQCSTLASLMAPCTG